MHARLGHIRVGKLTKLSHVHKCAAVHKLAHAHKCAATYKLTHAHTFEAGDDAGELCRKQSSNRYSTAICPQTHPWALGAMQQELTDAEQHQI
eukprot:1151688-Pelagomonas_calceolata.AAC.3